MFGGVGLLEGLVLCNLWWFILFLLVWLRLEVLWFVWLVKGNFGVVMLEFFGMCLVFELFCLCCGLIGGRGGGVFLWLFECDFDFGYGCFLLFLFGFIVCWWGRLMVGM